MSLLSKILGTLSNSFAIGDGAAGDKYIYADTGAANLPGFRRLNSSGVWEYSNDGSTWNSMAAAGASKFVQSAMAEVTADQTTTSGTWVDLVTLNITTGAGFLLLRATAGFSCSNASDRSMGLRLLVDGVAIRAITGGSSSTSTARSLAIVNRVAVTAAAHVVKLQWMVSGGYTLRCRPVAQPDLEHCSLVAEEVTA